MDVVYERTDEGHDGRTCLRREFQPGTSKDRLATVCTPVGAQSS